MYRRHSISSTLFAALAFVCCTAVQAQQPGTEPNRRSLSFDAQSSTVTFVLDATLHKVRGTASLRSGAISWNPDAGTCSGAIVIDATSLDTDNKKRDRDMHSKVLESEVYPTIEFMCTSFTGELDDRGNPKGAVDALGEFLIHGDSHSISVPMQFTQRGEGFTVEGVFDVPYVEWGMKDPSKAFLRVGKTVQISVSLVAEGD